MDDAPWIESAWGGLSRGSIYRLTGTWGDGVGLLGLGVRGGPVKRGMHTLVGPPTRPTRKQAEQGVPLVTGPASALAGWSGASHHLTAGSPPLAINRSGRTFRSPCPFSLPLGGKLGDTAACRSSLTQTPERVGT